MKKLILLFLASTVSCNSSVSSNTTKQEPVAEFPKTTGTQQISMPSPLTNGKLQTKFSFNSHVGAAEMISKTKMCLIVPNDNLTEGDQVSAVFADEPKSQSLVKAVVEKKLDQCGRKNHDVSGEVFYYSLNIIDENVDFESGSRNLGSVAIAFVGSTQPVNIKSGVASADLNGDKRSEHFRACTSNEGIHLTVWSGEPLKSRRQWHWYVGLDYDTEPNCTKKDYED